jgi:hypothetical protein
MFSQSCIFPFITFASSLFSVTQGRQNRVFISSCFVFLKKNLTIMLMMLFLVILAGYVVEKQDY